MVGMLLALSTAIVHHDRPDLDPKSEIAAYRYAISHCPGKLPILIPGRTLDAVYLPLKRSHPRLVRKDGSEGKYWMVELAPDDIDGLRTVTVDIWTNAGDSYSMLHLPIQLVRRKGVVHCRELPTTPLSASDEASLLCDAAGSQYGRVFVDSRPAVISIMRSRGSEVAPDKSFKNEDDFLSTGFIRIERPFVRWVAKDHAFASLATYFRPKKGDVTYALGGPYDLRWVHGKLQMKRLEDKWAGE